MEPAPARAWICPAAVFLGTQLMLKQSPQKQPPAQVMTVLLRQAALQSQLFRAPQFLPAQQ